MKTFKTAVMALALLWGLAGCVATPGYPTYGAYPYDYPSCATTYYGYGGPSYYGSGGCYPYYGTVFLGGYYSSYDRHHHHYYPHAVRAPHLHQHRHVTVDHRRHGDWQGRGDRTLTAPPHRVDRRVDRSVRGDDRSRERPGPGHGGEFGWRGDGKLRCKGARC
jgi:hypothetical protein